MEERKDSKVFIHSLRPTPDLMMILLMLNMLMLMLVLLMILMVLVQKRLMLIIDQSTLDR